MLAFANLGTQTSDLLPLGKAHLRDSAQDGARTLETFLAEVERKAFRIAQISLRHEAERRRIVRQRVMSVLPWRGEDAEEEMPDPIDQAPAAGPTPAAQIESDQMMQQLEQALTELPGRQREAFLLRNIEGLDVAETAASMKCSQGSVKTHYFRALQALRSKLGDFSI